jgi:hypothetical protein
MTGYGNRGNLQVHSADPQTSTLEGLETNRRRPSSVSHNQDSG